MPNVVRFRTLKSFINTSYTQPSDSHHITDADHRPIAHEIVSSGYIAASDEKAAAEKLGSACETLASYPPVYRT